VLRADAQVIWYPRRSAAEFVQLRQVRVAIVTAVLLNPKPHSVTRLIRSRPVVARLARLLNGMHAAPAPGAMSCPEISAMYRVAFAASPGGRQLLMAAHPAP
jgi:hypothetical protein